MKTVQTVQTLSAQVLLKTNSGRAATTEELTAERIMAILPSRASIDSVTQTFKAAGFQVGPVVGLTFSITGSAKLFESYFKLPPQQLGAGSLSLAQLPAAATAAIAEVVIGAAPAFGPGGGFA